MMRMLQLYAHAAMYIPSLRTHQHNLNGIFSSLKSQMRAARRAIRVAPKCKETLELPLDVKPDWEMLHKYLLLKV